MTKIEYKPLDIASLKVYAEKSPSKFADKFGDLDLDNIPAEFMKKRRDPIMGVVNGKDAVVGYTDEYEYFDSVAWRKMILSRKTRTPLLPHLQGKPDAINSVTPEVKQPEAPDMTPADMSKAPEDKVPEVKPKVVKKVAKKTKAKK